MARVQTETGFECEFPAELDEFLILCVEEHGEDWDAIADEFLDIADGLDESLLERANEFFSPMVLQQRWSELRNSENPQEAVAATTIAMPVAPIAEASLTAPAYPHLGDESEPASLPDVRPPWLAPVAASRPHHSNASVAVPVLPSTMDLGDEVNALLAELSEESGDDDDFAQVRRDMKRSSSKLASRRSSFTAAAVTAPSAAAPCQRPEGIVVCPPPCHDSNDRKKPWCASGDTSAGSDSDALEVQSTDGDDADEAYPEDDVDALPIRVIKHLLDKASNGQVSSYTWFNPTSQWPRLQVLLGNPEFSRCENGFKVVLDVARLMSILSAEQSSYAELCQRRAERAQLVSADFIRETEKRRLLIGGSLLHSRN